MAVVNEVTIAALTAGSRPARNLGIAISLSRQFGARCETRTRSARAALRKK